MSKLGIVERLPTEDLIQAVKKYKVLWDSTLEAYQNKVLRAMAWRNIIAVFIPDFHSMTSSEQNEIENAIRKRWKSIRTCYSRELLKQKSNDPNITGRKQYLYFDALRFLDLNSKCGSGTEEESTKRAPSPKLLTDPPAQRPPKKSATDAKRKAEENIPIPTKKRVVRRVNAEAELEADRMFLLSLVPDFHRVSSELKLQLKSDIINSVLRAQQQMPTSDFSFLEDLNPPRTSSGSTGARFLSNAVFHTNFDEPDKPGKEDLCLNPSSFGLEFVKIENSESLSSYERTPTRSDDGDDAFIQESM